MKNYFFLLFGLLVLSVSTQAQNAKSTSPKKPVNAFEKIMTDIGYPFDKLNDSTAVIVFDGANLKGYKLYCLKIDDMYIAYVNLTTALTKKIESTHYPILLAKNYSMDFVKIGMTSSSKEFYVRADVYINGTSASNFKKIVTQVADATDVIAAEIK